MKKITLDQMKNLPIEDITRLYQMGYRIDYDSKLSNLASNPIIDPFTNFGKATLSAGYNSSTTSIVLNTGNGSIFPDPSINGPFNLVWWNSTDYSDPSDDPNKEIVRCTARSGDTLTILRAQEGTTASIKNLAGKTYKIVLPVTAKVFTDIQTDSQTRVNTVVSAHSSAKSEIHGVVGNIVGTSDYQTLLNKIITDPSNYILASYIKSLTSIIDISSAAAPSAGQILTATSPTTAVWQSLSAPACFFVGLSASPSSGTSPLTVNYGVTIMGGVAPYTYSWTFGDGTVSTSPSPNHTFTANGTFTTSLNITDSTGNTATAVAIITVTTGVGFVATGLVLIDTISLPDLIGFYNAAPIILDTVEMLESIWIYNASASAGYSLQDSVLPLESTGIYNASTNTGSPLHDDVIPAELLAILSSISLPTSASVGKNSSITLTPTCYLYGSQVGCPLLTWSSSAPGVATVSSIGVVTGVANGTTNITSSSGVISNICTVTVS